MPLSGGPGRGDPATGLRLPLGGITCANLPLSAKTVRTIGLDVALDR